MMINARVKEILWLTCGNNLKTAALYMEKRIVMKKIALIFLAVALTMGSQAQRRNKNSNSHNHNGTINTQLGEGAPNSSMYQFRAIGHAEMFMVYVDGVPYNNEPSQRVFLNNIDPQQHDITLRLVRPADRVVSLTLDFSLPGMTFLLDYDKSTGIFSLNVPGSNMALPATASSVHRHQAPLPPVVGHNEHNHNQPYSEHHSRPEHHASDMEVGDLANMMYKASFDNDRLSMAKTFVKSKWICSAQAIRISRAITFDDSRLEFLLFAFDYCVDRENFYLTAETLNFNSNKKKLMKHIQTY